MKPGRSSRQIAGFLHVFTNYKQLRKNSGETRPMLTGAKSFLG